MTLNVPRHTLAGNTFILYTTHPQKVNLQQKNTFPSKNIRHIGTDVTALLTATLHHPAKHLQKAQSHRYEQFAQHTFTFPGKYHKEKQIII